MEMFMITRIALQCIWSRMQKPAFSTILSCFSSPCSCLVAIGVVLNVVPLLAHVLIIMDKDAKGGFFYDLCFFVNMFFETTKIIFMNKK
ncbi:LIM domain-containing protein WLIM2b-like [Iris pallida]|uniref:LIM domain-containing protein WLIM2b-like n=1 Tax=Iris pallida TaxID=29817 RepID=A0AAX6I3H4_IRIPA|nr:LIM domain-containing protein WLIM2b-like [Iris pallida]